MLLLDFRLVHSTPLLSGSYGCIEAGSESGDLLGFSTDTRRTLELGGEELAEASSRTEGRHRREVFEEVREAVRHAWGVVDPSTAGAHPCPPGASAAPYCDRPGPWQ